MKIKYILFFLICLLSACKEKLYEEKPRNILFVHAFYKGETPPQGTKPLPDDESDYFRPAYHIDESLQGITDAFKDNGVPIRLKDTYLGYGYNTARLKTMEHILNFTPDNRPDVILIQHEAALNVFLTTRNTVFDIPVVFCGVINSHLDSTMRQHSNITGFTSCPDINEMVRLSQKLFPQTRNIRFLQTDISAMGTTAKIFSALNLPEGIEADLSYLENSRSKDVLNELKNTDRSASHNYVGILPYWEEFFSRIVKMSDYPFLTSCYVGLGSGALGGYMVSSYDETYAAAERASQILKGEKISDFSIDPLPPQYIFDWNVVEKFHLATEQFPQNVRFINQPFLVRYQTPISIASVCLSFIFILLFAYYGTQYQQKQISGKKQKINKKQLKTIISSIQEGVICVDNQFSIFEINQECLKLLLLQGTPESYYGQSVFSLFDVVLPDSPQSLQSLLKRLRTEEKSFSYYGCRLVRAAYSHSFNALLEISPIIQDQQIIGEIITLHDITEKQSQNDYINFIMKNKGIIIWQYDPQIHQILSNYNFETGITNEKINALPIEMFEDKIHPDDLPTWKKKLKQTLEQKGVHLLLQVRLRNLAGEYIWWKSRFTSLDLSAQGTSFTIFGVFIQIQAHKELETKLEKARHKVELSDRLKSAFLANMSHEIRTPLNGIVGFANLLCDRDQFEPEETAVFIETIQKNCDLLLALISDIIDISCIESNTINYHFEDCDINDLINQIVTTQRVIIPAHLKLIKQIPVETTLLHIDKLRLNQVITNLINNAVKFTEQGSITVGYTADHPDNLDFFVQDTGRGIPEEDLKNVFLRYFKKDNHVQGAGLGLSICQMFVNRFDGEITVRSEVGVGTCFNVKIPRTPKNE